MLSLIIKGGIAAAVAAASQRQIELTSLAQTHPFQTLATCRDEYRDQVNRWFLEEPEPAPFPPGVLLHFSEMKAVP